MTASTENTTPLDKLSANISHIDLTGHPPVDKWQPGHQGTIDIVIKADGSWWHEGSVFRRDALVKLFAGILWLEDGNYYLKTPVEQLQIQVEEVPFFITGLEVTDPGTEHQQLVFTSSYGDVIVADNQHKLWVEEDTQSGAPAPYLEVRYGMKGKLSRNVFYQLGEIMQQAPCPPAEQQSADHAAASGDCLFVHSRGIAFLVGTLSNA